MSMSDNNSEPKLSKIEGLDAFKTHGDTFGVSGLKNLFDRLPSCRKGAMIQDMQPMTRSNGIQFQFCLNYQ